MEAVLAAETSKHLTTEHKQKKHDHHLISNRHKNLQTGLFFIDDLDDGVHT
jgi:hypothetical protein